MIDQPASDPTAAPPRPDDVVVARADVEVARRDHDALLAAVAAHLRQPLLSVIGFAELVGERAAPSLDAEARDHLDRLRTNADVVAHQLDALEALAGLRSHLASDDDLADLEVVTTAVAVAVRHRAPGMRVSVGRLPVVRVPYRLAGELVERLLDNCARHAGPEPEVAVATAVGPDGAVAVTVADDGPGIDPADRERVLELFERGPGNQRGVGAGLAVVARIMDLVGGTVAVTEAPGGGAQVELWFPPDRVVGWDPER